MSASSARRRANPALAIFGLLCVAVSILVLVGERDWAWLADSFLGPAILCGLGGVVLAATLWPGRDDRPVEVAPVPPSNAAGTAGTGDAAGTAGTGDAAGTAGTGDAAGTAARAPDDGSPPALNTP